MTFIATGSLNMTFIATAIATASGGTFDYADIHPDDLDIEDAATALSRLPRFLGHTTEFYSVAQHCVAVSDACAALFPDDATSRRWGLLHDLSEAWIGDMPGPLKRLLPDFVALERRIMQAAAERFNLSWEMPQAVKIADQKMLVTEARLLMRNHAWAHGIDDFDIRLEPVSAEVARAQFLAAFDRLFPGFRAGRQDFRGD